MGGFKPVNFWNNRLLFHESHSCFLSGEMCPPLYLESCNRARVTPQSDLHCYQSILLLGKLLSVPPWEGEETRQM